MELFSSVIILPFGNMPLIGSVLGHYEKQEQRKILLRENLIALGLLMLFLFGGGPILNFLKLDTSTLSITGGFILLLIALGMLFPSKSVLYGSVDEKVEEPFIVPIATPLVAGPSSLTFVILMAKQHSDKLVQVTMATVAAWGISFALLMCSPWLIQALGRRGMRAMERLMGMILILISSQMVLDGIAVYVKNIG